MEPGDELVRLASGGAALVLPTAEPGVLPTAEPGLGLPTAEPGVPGALGAILQKHG